MIMAIMKIKEDIMEARRKGLEEGTRQGRKAFLDELAGQGFDLPNPEAQEDVDVRYWEFTVKLSIDRAKGLRGSRVNLTGHASPRRRKGGER